MKNILLPLLFCLIYNSISAQTTAIPDPAFEQALINLSIDSDGIINGHILTTDALNVTNLTITSSDNQNFIGNLTGLEAFINVDTLKVSYTMITELNVNALVNLKYLLCVDNMLTSIDVSNNTLLEHLDITSGGDVPPFNQFTEIDLSNNPNIKKLIGNGLNYINLKNGNNNPEMYLNISPFFTGEFPEDVIFGSTCIEIDNEDLAQANQFPYSEWNIHHPNWAYSLVESCTAGTSKFQKNKIVTLYPNPATNVVNITSSEPVTEAAIYNLLVQKVKQLPAGSATLTTDVSGLTAGTYFVVVKTDKGSKTEKLIIR